MIVGNFLLNYDQLFVQYFSIEKKKALLSVMGGDTEGFGIWYVIF